MAEFEDEMRSLARAAVVAIGIAPLLVGTSSAQTARIASVGSAPAAVVSGQATRTADLTAATAMELTVVLMPKGTRSPLSRTRSTTRSR
jgi:hypothetical protein